MAAPTKDPDLDYQEPSCKHIFHAQTDLSPLPPLYIAAPTFQNPSIQPSTITKLTRALADLGTPHTHTPFVNKDIVTLRKELEGGMTRERRQVMQFYILRISDTRKRAAAEFYLARYKGFTLGVDGRLGFGLERGSGVGGEEEQPERGWNHRASSLEDAQGQKSRRSAVNCGVM
ncbi:hypothetical protein VTL71DRAFT_6804 [Oculimacula yallundae]|uniref:Uncharacterized protein n=1 Tax=Oculimacula yallundae TaxID=86028 RepID=A0ABR4BY17_9HELO